MLRTSTPSSSKAGGSWSGSTFLTPPPGGRPAWWEKLGWVSAWLVLLGTYAGHSLAEVGSNAWGGAKQALGPSDLLTLGQVTSDHFTSTWVSPNDTGPETPSRWLCRER